MRETKICTSHPSQFLFTVLAPYPQIAPSSIPLPCLVYVLPSLLFVSSRPLSPLVPTLRPTCPPLTSSLYTQLGLEIRIHELNVFKVIIFTLNEPKFSSFSCIKNQELPSTCLPNCPLVAFVAWLRDVPEISYPDLAIIHTPS